ncbi:hypothetical protein M758_6G019800 [Ceratodon purpureus]|uniref:Secreted protein n=1 Tax=Ceratodon purpureus TaxID=3225 RepID=A0A8T0HAN9_CERPU|nr:hypothetical protein KC19_6G022300 [Ceratodon purpureus]KAG0612341.1 hypothetical protein M758_6G019800 [Ceratodon purpureus]
MQGEVWSGLAHALAILARSLAPCVQADPQRFFFVRGLPSPTVPSQDRSAALQLRSLGMRAGDEEAGSLPGVPLMRCTVVAAMALPIASPSPPPATATQRNEAAHKRVT